MFAPPSQPERREWNRNNGNGNGYGRRNGFQQNGFRRNDPNHNPHRLTDTSIHPPTVPHRDANEKAERIVLCALLTDDWMKFTLGRLLRSREHGGTIFKTPRFVALCDALLELLEGRISIQQAISQLADRELANTASEILFAQEGDEPLTEELIDGCIERLVRTDLRDQERRIYLQTAEGAADLDAEQLRKWQRSAQARKQHLGAEETE